MATRIPYLDETWSPVTGCGDDMVSPGCLNCYARRMFGRNLWKCRECDGTGGYLMTGPPAELNGVCECPVCHGTGHQDFTPTFHASRLDQPLHWRKPRVVGVSFMGDWAHPAFSDSQIMNIFGVMAAAPQHEYLFLTKRPERQKHLLQLARDTSVRFRDGTIHTWAGATVCNQAEADRNIPILLATPAAKRWVSLEPMLGPVDLFPWVVGDISTMTTGSLTDWVVTGGETGPGARPMLLEWALDVFDQCRAAGVPFYWKQSGDWLKRSEREIDDETARRVFDMGSTRELPAVTP